MQSFRVNSKSKILCKSRLALLQSCTPSLMTGSTPPLGVRTRRLGSTDRSPHTASGELLVRGGFAPVFIQLYIPPLSHQAS